MAAIRTAEVTWNGALLDGAGTIDYVTSGAFTRLPVTWASRTEAADGRTSPEELARVRPRRLLLDGLLGRPRPQRDPADAAQRHGDRHVRQGRGRLEGRLVGADRAGHGPRHRRRDGSRELAEAAKDGCPISGALKGNVALSVEATLEG